MNALHDWIVFSLMPQASLLLFHRLQQQFQLSSMAALVRANKHCLSHVGLNEIQVKALLAPDHKQIEGIYRWLEGADHHVIFYEHPLYPDRLKEIYSPPILLYAQGDPTILSHPQIAMVGSRNPTHTGLDNAKNFAYGLAQAKFVITSGLAIGIDGAAHRGALMAKQPTIAVLGSGLKNIYPKRHVTLATEITSNGCLVSEFPLEYPILRENFPMRNRIISGLSLGTLVIEASRNSGSLITARFALEQNRDVFAIPGTLRNPMAFGCLDLIKNGAVCVTDINDILLAYSDIAKETALKSTKITQYKHDQPSAEAQKVLKCLNLDEITGIDQICERSKLSAQKVMAALLSFELTGEVIKMTEGYLKL